MSKNKTKKRRHPFLVFYALFVAATVLLAAWMRVIYFALYLLATPKICLPDEVWQQLWRLF